MKKKIPILFVADGLKNLNTGIATFCEKFGNELIQNKNHNLIIDFHLREKNKNIFPILNNKNFVFYNPIHKYFYPKQKKYELVHMSDQFCKLRPRMFSKKILITVHDLNQLYESENEYGKVFMNKLSKYLERANHIVAISNFVANDVKKNFPFTENKISVIYNGTEVPKNLDFKKNPKTQFSQKPFLFTIGNISFKKNFHVLINLLKKNDFELLIAGRFDDDLYYKKIIEEIDFFEVKDRVKFLDIISEEEKFWYYKNCKAFLFPSLAEGFGFPVIEAMNFGKPVFISNRTSLPEIAGNYGYVFENFEHEHMQKVFVDGLNDYMRNKEQREIEIKNWAKQFSWEKCVNEYLKVYEKTLSS